MKKQDDASARHERPGLEAESERTTRPVTSFSEKSFLSLSLQRQVSLLSSFLMFLIYHFNVTAPAVSTFRNISIHTLRVVILRNCSSMSSDSARHRSRPFRVKGKLKFEVDKWTGKIAMVKCYTISQRQYATVLQLCGALTVTKKMTSLPFKL